MGVVTKQETSSTAMKEPALASSSAALRRTSDWVFSQDIPSDVTVVAGGVAYALHKFPLVSRCGWIRKLVADAADSELSRIELPDFPGGAESFELAAKFCYGINFEIGPKNAAALRCAAEYLEMTEEYAEENMIARTEAFLNEVVINNLSNSVAVLQTCESLLPMAEELEIVSRCVEGAAAKAGREQMMNASLSRSDFSSSGRMDGIGSSPSFIATPKRRSLEWWAEEISVLRIDFYHRVISAMKARGVRHDSLGSAIVLYAQRSLRGLSRKQSALETANRTKSKSLDSATTLEHEQRIFVETIVSLLPSERNTTSVSFLFGLLRTAIYLDTTIACRLDLERRIGLQLEQASLDDLLIPSYSYSGDTLFDIDTVQRIVVNFLQQEGGEEDQDALAIYDYESTGSPPQSSIMKVARLLDCYLAEVAPDANLGVAKFVGLAEFMPEYARVVDDGLYRAIDIYLKAHPGLNELERKKVCSLMDCQKLSREACTHAAQNERLPVQIIVQVLYFEQTRLRNAMAGSYAGSEMEVQMSKRMNYGGALSVAISPRDEYAAMHRENRELKMEMARMKTKMQQSKVQQDQDHRDEDEDEDQEELQQQDHHLHQQQKQQQDRHLHRQAPAPVRTKLDGEKPKSRFFQSFSKKLGKLNPFSRSSSNDASLKTPDTPDLKTSRRRRHSIS